MKYYLFWSFGPVTTQDELLKKFISIDSMSMVHGLNQWSSKHCFSNTKLGMIFAQPKLRVLESS